MRAATLRSLDLFSGIGGFALGFERAGIDTVMFCEIEPFPRRVLAERFPGRPIHDDVRTLSADAVLRATGPVDVICGGFPCQDVSESNVNGAGIDGQRSGLWSEMHRLIRDLRPKFAVVENVSNLLVRGLGRVLGDLAGIGYDAEWRGIRACDVGAPHIRARTWIIAYPSASERRSLDSARGRVARRNPVLQGQEIADGFARFPAQAWHEPWTETHARLSRLDDGLPCGVAGFNAYANAVVPQIAEMIGCAILSVESSMADNSSGSDVPVMP